MTSAERDPVCGMTVHAGPSAHPFEHDGVTYHFCCVGCRDAFAKDPAAFPVGSAEESTSPTHLTTQEA